LQQGLATAHVLPVIEQRLRDRLLDRLLRCEVDHSGNAVLVQSRHHRVVVRNARLDERDVGRHMLPDTGGEIVEHDNRDVCIA
jgi:hypothetical protein